MQSEYFDKFREIALKVIACGKESIPDYYDTICNFELQLVQLKPKLLDPDNDHMDIMWHFMNNLPTNLDDYLLHLQELVQTKISDPANAIRVMQLWQIVDAVPKPLIGPFPIPVYKQIISHLEVLFQLDPEMIKQIDTIIYELNDMILDAIKAELIPSDATIPTNLLTDL